MDRLTNTQIAAMTGIHHTHVCAAKRQLIERKFLIADGVKIGVNKVVSQWISQDSLTLAKTANKTLAKSATQRSLLMLTRLSKVSVLMFLLGVSACKSPPPVQSQRPEPAAWAMEKAQDLQQMLNSIITVSEVESTG